MANITETLKEQFKDLISEDSLNQIETVFNEAVEAKAQLATEAALVKQDEDHATKVQQLLEAIDDDHTKKLNKIVEAITGQAAVSLQNAQGLEEMEKTREKEMQFLDIVSDVTAEIDLGSLLQRVMLESTRMLNADRATLFLNDPKTEELFSRVAMGDGIGEIRLPNSAGIAGAVFQSQETINIPHAYADLRFNPGFDKQTGYFTRSILCVPIINKEGECIG